MKAIEKLHIEKEPHISYKIFDGSVRTLSFAILWTSVGKQRDLGRYVDKYLDEKLNEVAENIENLESKDYFIEKSTDPRIRQYLSVTGQLTYITLDMAGKLKNYSQGNQFHPAVAECAFDYGLDSFCQKIIDDYLTIKNTWGMERKKEEMEKFDSEIKGRKTQRGKDDREMQKIKDILEVSYNRINSKVSEFSPKNYELLHKKRLESMGKLKDALLRYYAAENGKERLESRIDMGDCSGEIEYYHLASSFKDFPESYKKFQKLRGRAAILFDDFKDFDIDKAKGLGYRDITRKKIGADFIKEFVKSYLALPFWSWDKNKYLAFSILAGLFHVREMIGVKARS